MNLQYVRTILVICWCLLTFVGCGGGGGGGGDSSGNASPVADAGADRTEFISDSETKIVTLTGTATDSDGTIVSHHWEPTNGTNASLSGANTATATFSIDATEGDYTFSYTVTDDDGAQASDDVTITVSVNDIPTADAGVNQTASEGDTVTLDGSGSSDSDGTISTYAWTQIDSTGITVTLSDTSAPSPSFTVPDVDTAGAALIFRLTVTDDGGAQGTDEVSISLNLKPVAVAGADQTKPEGQTVTLNGSGSSDPDGTIATYTWTQTDSTGITVTLSDASAPSPTFTAPDVDSGGAILTFQLTVTDDDGAEQSDTVAVYVTNVLLSDSFADMGNWTTIEESGETASWASTNGQLRQSAYVASDPFYDSTSTYQLGTYALLSATASITGMTSYRVSVDITPQPNNLTDDSEGNDVGIMFGYEDANNYYRVAMNAKFGYTRFEKRTDAGFETLAVNAIGYVENQTMTMAAEINGDAIIVWINDDPVFATVDSSVPSGTLKVALYCQDYAYFDNVLITENSLQPTVVIAAPLAYSVTPSNAIDINAVVLNAPSGSSVVATLDGSTDTITTLSGNYYTVTFSGLSAIDHDILVSLNNADGVEINYDLNSMVGTGGDYIVTIGDSITNGVGDSISTNNESADGRIVAIQGYQAPLADALATTTGLPQIVFNEGIPGDRSEHLVDRIDSILERHPMANKFLAMIGTNDSNPNGANVDPDDFEYNVESIATSIDDMGGKQLWLAKPLPTYENDDPPTTLNTTRNDNIEQYNLKIESIVSNHANTSIGPDLYSNELLNLTYNPAFAYYFEDYLHPNDAGYAVMADEWHDILTQ